MNLVSFDNWENFIGDMSHVKKFFIKYISKNNHFSEMILLRKERGYNGGEYYFKLYSFNKIMKYVEYKDRWGEYDKLKSLNPDINYIIQDYYGDKWDDDSRHYDKYLILDETNGETKEVTDNESLVIIKK